MTRASFLPLCIFAAACAGAPSRERTAPADLDILFLGNSHTAYHDLPDMVVAMLRAAHPGRAIDHVVAPGWLFLDERLHDPATLRLLRERRWDVVVLQAQRTSSSGRRTYSTAAAESLIELARDAHALPILFPEWPRHGVAETDRIYELHVGIAAREPACVAPVGQAWDLARAVYPDLVLHADDGNHAAPAGAYLTALILAATIADTSPDNFNSHLPQFGVPFADQARLRSIAARAVVATPTRTWCPADGRP